MVSFQLNHDCGLHMHIHSEWHREIYITTGKKGTIYENQIKHIFQTFKGSYGLRTMYFCAYYYKKLIKE